MSVFTFDPDPPRVSSPWLRLEGPAPETPGKPSAAPESGWLPEHRVTKLEAEPQDGPTEYKLHLLLRPRRSYRFMSTTKRIPGSTQSRLPLDPKSAKAVTAFAPTPSPSPQSRQARLQHLTTQLLWRLQQTCPSHSDFTTTESVSPQLPDDGVGLGNAVRIGRLPPGLEASRGALYEIGVADDGSLVGLTKDEMDESLATLRVMAASLGCTVKVPRMVTVGQCEWVDGGSDALSEQSRAVAATPSGVIRQEQLWVSEALVVPSMASRDTPSRPPSADPRPSPRHVEILPAPAKGASATQQLRVTLTGPTTSGKSTLLGTLSTGTLDNGHGKSRQTLFKHRHEIETGVTSSVAQELIGYNDNSIVNYTRNGIESWIEIHDFAKDGRLVFLLDSAGHPRYRRTILRGIVGWAPHWTLLCIAADDMETSHEPDGAAPAEDGPGAAGAGVDLAKAHLDLCLSLELPFAVVITKLDLARRASLQRTLTKVLSALKAAGRTPRILQPEQSSNRVPAEIPPEDAASVQTVIESIREAGTLRSVVPIIMTSAVKGSGIGLVHALLQSLPLPPVPTSHDHIGPALNPEQPECLFHIEDRFSLPASYASLSPHLDPGPDVGTVVAGYMRFGSLSVGDRVLVGPFPSEDESRGATPATPDNRPSPGSFGLSVSHPSSADLARISMKHAVAASAIEGEWHSASIVSVRNLRLPVETLDAGQVGSIGIVFDVPKDGAPLGPSLDGFSKPRELSAPRLRKGMVLAIPTKHMMESNLSLQAASGLVAVFRSPDAASIIIGSLVNIYIASVRAAARVTNISRGRSTVCRTGYATRDADDDVFGLSEYDGLDDLQSKEETAVEVQLELLTNREWIELGSRIVILEGGSKDKSGLEGFIGKVVEIVD